MSKPAEYHDEIAEDLLEAVAEKALKVMKVEEKENTAAVDTGDQQGAASSQTLPETSKSVGPVDAPSENKIEDEQALQ